MSKRNLHKALAFIAIALLFSLSLTSCDFAMGYIKIPEFISEKFFDCSTCYDSGKINCEICGGDHKVICKRCSGSGQTNCHMCHGSGRITCGGCGGSGFTMQYTYSPTYPYYQMRYMPCGGCGGSGGRACTPRASCSCNGGIVECSSCDDGGKLDCPDC